MFTGRPEGKEAKTERKTLWQNLILVEHQTTGWYFTEEQDHYGVEE